MNKSIFHLILFIFIGIKSNTQISPDSTKFRNPMDIPLIVAGNFGEVRFNHFHTGIDFKTQGVVGKKIKSIEDGYISRIAFSHWGYGRAIYITHPNGYTSVYAHLSKFNLEIEKYTRKKQYKNKKEIFNIYLDSNVIIVKKGQVIAFSGNSGSSTAPHLHFEIRETASETLINPLLFGYQIKDIQKPVIKRVKFYPLAKNALINGKNKSEIISVKKNKHGNYILKKPITALGKIGISIHTFDKMNAPRNICGAYSIKSECNNSVFFYHEMKRLDFSTGRFVNHHVDYTLHKLRRQNFHKTFLFGENKLPIYSNVKQDGILDIKPNSFNKLKFTVKDYKGNSTVLRFIINGSNKLINKKESLSVLNPNYSKKLNYKTANYFDTIGFSLLMPENCLYQDLNFKYKSKKNSTYLSDIYQVHTKYTAVHQYYKLMLSPNQKIDSNLFSKLLIVQIDGKRVSAKGGEITPEGNITTRVREFGDFAIAIDSTKPKIQLITDTSFLLKLTPKSIIKLKISDNLSGIESYTIFMDGKWILANYKRKKGQLWIDFSKTNSMFLGKHYVKIKVIDERGNENVVGLDVNIK